jgi:hypothetical protein
MTLAPNLPLPPTQIRHPHNLDHQARPPRKMLRSLPLASLRIILFPSEPSLRPCFVDCFHEIESEAGVQIFGFLLIGTGGLCVSLNQGDMVSGA